MISVGNNNSVLDGREPGPGKIKSHCNLSMKSLLNFTGFFFVASGDERAKHSFNSESFFLKGEGRV